MTLIKNRRRARQIYSYDGLSVNGSWATDIDGVLEWRNRGYVFFELKRPNTGLPDGQRKALERLVDDVKAAGKQAILLLCENAVDNPYEDVKVKDCRVLKVYDGTWRDSPYVYAGDVVNSKLFNVNEQLEREDSVNVVVIVGRITRDVECRYSGSGMAIAKFSVAVDRPRTKDGEKGADFIPVTVFGKAAENCEKYLHKGSRVGVSGRIQTGSYEKNGTKVYTTDVIANNVEFLESKGSGAPAEHAPKHDDVSPQFEQIEDDVPW